MSRVLIGFSTRKSNPLSMLIRKVTKSKCSHAWLMYRDSFFNDRYMVLEATEWGVRVIDAEIFWSRNLVVAVFLPQVDLTDAVRNSGKIIGQLYDFFGLFGMAFVVMAAKWLKKKIANPLQSPRGLFCSELVMEKMKESNYPGTEKIDSSTISPDEEMRLLSKEGDFRVDFPQTPSECFTKLCA